MQICYDGTIFSTQAYGGINTYFSNLLSRLPEDVEARVILTEDGRGVPPDSPRTKVERAPATRIWPMPLAARINRHIYRRRLNEAGTDILHPTYYSLLTGLPIEGIRPPIVLTVWDMIHELYPEQYDPTGLKTAIKKKAILAASAILCISEATKRDLLSFYRIPESRIRVTLLAPGLKRPTDGAADTTPQAPYFLYVGGRKFHKNFDGLLRAFARVASAVDDVTLCVVGRPFNASEGRLLDELRLADRVKHRGQVDDALLAVLYSHSVALVYPSLYEGFGIPPLDAMVCGTAVIATDSSSLPEVVGNAALLFDPERGGDLEEKMVAITRSPALRDRLVAAGREWVKGFSWDKTADSTFAVYRSLL
jgi:glycosyltransferase involved in cell wall biosynthesis